MASKKSKKGRRAYATDPLTIIIREKAKKFVSAEREYWKQRNSLQQSMKETVHSLSLMVGEALPTDISSTVWGLRDGVAFVRHKSISGPPIVQLRILPVTLDQWGETGLVIPINEGEFSLAAAGIRGLGHIILMHCSINGILVPYAELSHMRYGDELSIPAVERAVLDLQLTLLGLQAPTTPEESGPSRRLSAESTIERLQGIARQFEELLRGNEQEEALQRFLKEHPFVLHQSAESIPKQKLGEDFVTDFVLVATTTQGPTYTLVELERASHPVLTKDYVLASPVNHAIKQTRDWDIWLERNKAYVQNKLPGFETPRYMVVIGRSVGFTEDQKAYIRSYNRDWKNLELLTYDDVLSRFQATTERLKATLAR